MNIDFQETYNIQVVYLSDKSSTLDIPSRIDKHCTGHIIMLLLNIYQDISNMLITITSWLRTEVGGPGCGIE